MSFCQLKPCSRRVNAGMTSSLSNCPAGHPRHRATCVWRRLVPAWPQTTTQTHAKIHKEINKKTPKINRKIAPKSIKKHKRSRFGGVLGRLGGGLGTILRPRAAPKAPETKKVTKSSLNPRSFLVFRGIQNRQFSTVLHFNRLFCGRFSEACFGGLRPHFLDNFGMLF